MSGADAHQKRAHGLKASDLSKSPTPSRRNLFLGIGALAAIAGGWQWAVNRPRSLEFAAIPGLDGWRQTQAGGMTTLGGNATSAVLIGIDSEDVTRLPPAKLCPALYRNRDSGVPVAVFSDFFCPNCRILDARLASRSDLAITWHQLPLLGPSSELVAHALMAADRQDGYVAMRDQLLSAPFRPMLQTFLEAAILAGLDAEQLGRDMHESAVAARLAESRSAAQTLGVWGTPAITVGRTLAMGALDHRQLDQLIEAERDTVC